MCVCVCVLMRVSWFVCACLAVCVLLCPLTCGQGSLMAQVLGLDQLLSQEEDGSLDHRNLVPQVKLQLGEREGAQSCHVDTLLPPLHRSADASLTSSIHQP